MSSFNGKVSAASENGGISEIVIDWVGWLDLHDNLEDVDQPLKIDIRKVRFYELIAIYFSHPDPFNRLVSWMSMLFTVIGIIIGYYLPKMFS